MALAVAIVAWGRFAAPRSQRRLASAPRIAFELTVFSVAVVALLLAGAPVAAAVLAVLVATSTALLTRFDQVGGVTGGDRRRDQLRVKDPAGPQSHLTNGECLGARWRRSASIRKPPKSEKPSPGDGFSHLAAVVSAAEQAPGSPCPGAGDCAHIDRPAST
jgi:hypothetical protein